VVELVFIEALSVPYCKRIPHSGPTLRVTRGRETALHIVPMQVGAGVKLHVFVVCWKVIGAGGGGC
jgi:hypothetical protein